MVGILLFSPVLRADLVLVQKVEESAPGKQSTEITLKVKGEKIRVDVPPEVSLLMDTASGSTITLHHAQKTALEVSGTAFQQLARRVELLRESREREGNAAEPARLEATGRRESVAGQESRIYTAQTGAVKMTYWIVQNGPDTERFLELLELLHKAPMVQLAGGMAFLSPDFKFPGVPVKTEMALPDGRKITTTILSIKEQPLENLDFTVPLDYRSLPKPLFGPPPPQKTP
jgi:Domain of unknown function (DUF4412)